MKTPLILAFLWVCVSSTKELSCPCQIQPIPCHIPETENSCPYGLTTDPCGCCPMCAKGPGEVCGGPWRVHGSCGAGFNCIPNPGHEDRIGFTGKCQRT